MPGQHATGPTPRAPLQLDADCPCSTGGRFPSDLQVNAQRGMQVPHSPSDASSGFLDNEYAHGASINGNVTNDYEAVAAASALPGSQVGEPYPGTRSPQIMVGQNYGNSQGIQMDAAPSHAAMVHDEAVADGVNPYSGEPAMPQYNNSQRFSAAPVVVAGPHHVNSSQPPDISHYSGNAGAYNASSPVYSTSAASPAYYGHASIGQTGNGSAKGGDRMGAAYGQQQQQQNGQHEQLSRPGFQGRTDSTPHVPGEYPRSTPATTPSVY